VVREMASNRERQIVVGQIRHETGVSSELPSCAMISPGHAASFHRERDASVLNGLLQEPPEAMSESRIRLAMFEALSTRMAIADSRMSTLSSGQWPVDSTTTAAPSRMSADDESVIHKVQHEFNSSTRRRSSSRVRAVGLLNACVNSRSSMRIPASWPAIQQSCATTTSVFICPTSKCVI
jgi:hypothetical protein